jgi:hypothetical protein
MSTVFQCLKPDYRYIPTLKRLVYEAPTETAAIQWLEQNGGGIYRNLLHNFDMKVDGISQTIE